MSTIPMIACMRCSTFNVQDASFCDKCGLPLNTYSPNYTEPQYMYNAPQPPLQQWQGNAPSLFTTFTQMFGVHPLPAFGVLAADWMLFGGEAVTFGVSWTISILVSLALSVGVFLAQKHLYKDEDGAALAKSIILGVLLAIPTAIPTLLLMPSTALGAIKSLRK